MSSQISEANLSPMMEQYWKIKNLHQDYILFFRMGDFYEMFYDDAKIASSILGVVLTSRSNGLKNAKAPMCGIPYHSYESYVNRLIKKGYKVAICEQTEVPEEAKKRAGTKAVVNREVKRIMTPGTLMEDSLLDSNKYNYLLSIYQDRKQVYLSWVDVSTGDFYVQSTEIDKINNFLYKIDPTEILISEKFNINYLSEEFRALIYVLETEKFNTIIAKSNFSKYFPGVEHNKFSKGEYIASGVILGYLFYTHKEIDLIAYPQQKFEDGILRIDAFTRKSLEISKSNNSFNEGTLKKVIDNTLTAQGSRELDSLLHNPILNIKDINHRYDVVDYFVKNSEQAFALKNILVSFVDFERLLGKIAGHKATIKELILLKQILHNLTDIRGIFYNKEIPELLKDIIKILGDYNNLLDSLDNALIELEDLPTNWKEGNFVKRGYDPKLDEIKNRKQNYLQKTLELQSKYMAKLGINNLKINYSNVQGYYIEVASKNTALLSNDSIFSHKSTLSNAVRYTTEELIKIEGEISVSSAQALTAEMLIFTGLIDKVLLEQHKLNQSSKAISLLDVMLSFTTIALKYNLVRPVLDNTTNFQIIKGRHLVVEESLKVHNKEAFIANDCCMLNNKSIHLLTGPNMSGKSTFLRQQALIIIMAQMGCFVPAEKAHIGIVDAIFSRVGASDDLFKGQSTFMVEMLELSTILNCATSHSFLILDEIGRGTSTYDGLAIAWASLEYLDSSLKSRTIFATHYHELTALTNLTSLDFYYVDVKESNKSIVFMHKVKAGMVSKSYGIEVAKIAGLPKSVIKRAKEVLSILEINYNHTQIEDLPLFNNISHVQESHSINILDIQTVELQAYKNLMLSVETLDIDNMSAKGALDFLYKLKVDLSQISEE